MARNEGETEPASTRRMATVDVGTNSIRLLVAETGPSGPYRLLDDEKVVTRLGRGMHARDRLSVETMEESARVISHMRTIAEGYGVEALRAVATSAVREAENRDAFLELVRREAGIDLEIISGDEEARLAWLSAEHAFDLRRRDVAVVDIGGGSTEIVLGSDGVIGQIYSIPLGAVRLTEAADEETAPAERLRRMRKLVRRALKAGVQKPATPPDVVIGTGGTFTALAAIDLLEGVSSAAAGEGSPAGVRGHEILRPALRHHLERLNAMTPARRASVPGLSPDRADIIVAGLVIADRVLRRLGAPSLLVHDRGIRDGLLLRTARELFPGATGAGPCSHDPMAPVRTFAERCRYERGHSEHVTALALQIYDQLRGRIAELPDDDGASRTRELLQAAAILHDVGYAINYARHHKHSYHLIVHSELPGFSPREREIIANVARYHRRAHPKRGHPGFQRLAPADREMVRRLAAILRIADGLDRAHSGIVNRVEVRVERATAWFGIDADRAPDVDLWGAARKSQLFASVFGMEPRFHRIGDAAAAAAANGHGDAAQG